MNLPVNLLPRPRPDFFPLDSRARQIGRYTSVLTVSPTSFKDCTPVVAAGKVLVITRIHGAVTGRSATTLVDEIVLRLTDGTNTRDLPIAVPGLVNTEPAKFTLDLQPGRCLALGCATATPLAGMKLQVKVSDAGIYFAPVVEGFWMSREDARTLNIEPVVLAASDEFAGNGFVAGFHAATTDATEVVPMRSNDGGATGLSAQVEWMCVFGHAADASAAQNVLLEFSDLDSTHHKFSRIYNKSAATTGIELLQANGLEINGPYGYGVRATNSKESAFSVIVGGRYVGKHNTCDPTGVHTGPIAATGKKFWSYFEDSLSGALDFGSKQLFATDGAPVAGLKHIAHVRGAILSISKTTGADVGAIAICAGADLAGLTGAVVGPTLGVATCTDGTTKVTGTQSVMVDGLDLPMALAGTTQNVFINAGITTGTALIAGTVFGRLRPASEITMQTTSGLDPLTRIYKAIT